MVTHWREESSEEQGPDTRPAPMSHSSLELENVMSPGHGAPTDHDGMEETEVQVLTPQSLVEPQVRVVEEGEGEEDEQHQDAEEEQLPEE